MLLHIAEHQQGRVYGIAVDAVSGEPLRQLNFRITSGASRSRVQNVVILTDEQGRFAVDMLAGRVRVFSNAGEATPARVRLDCMIGYTLEDPWRIEFRVGPTLELKLRGPLPQKLSLLDFWLLRSASKRPSMKTFLRQSTPDLLWVRAPADRQQIPEGERLHFIVCDREGLFFGASEHVWGEPLDQQPLVIHMQATSALLLTWNAERPAKYTTKDAQDIFIYKPDFRTELSSLATPQELPAGKWRLTAKKCLPAGLYDLRLSSREHRNQEHRLDLLAGQVREFDAQLKLHESSRTVRGRVRTRSCAPMPDITVTVSIKGDTSRSWWAQYSTWGNCIIGSEFYFTFPGDEDTSIAEFVFERVPPGELEVHVSVRNTESEVEIVGETAGDSDIQVLPLDD